MKISPRKRFYHGSPVRIEQFDSSFMNKGTQALGSVSISVMTSKML